VIAHSPPVRSRAAKERLIYGIQIYGVYKTRQTNHERELNQPRFSFPIRGHEIVIEKAI
jgi:hypothetical protein